MNIDTLIKPSVYHAALHNAQKPHAAHAAFAQTPYYFRYYTNLLTEGKWRSNRFLLGRRFGAWPVEAAVPDTDDPKGVSGWHRLRGEEEKVCLTGRVDGVAVVLN
jgi:hypothetical protein